MFHSPSTLFLKDAHTTIKLNKPFIVLVILHQSINKLAESTAPR